MPPVPRRLMHDVHPRLVSLFVQLELIRETEPVLPNGGNSCAPTLFLFASQPAGFRFFQVPKLGRDTAFGKKRRRIESFESLARLAQREKIARERPGPYSLYLHREPRAIETRIVSGAGESRLASHWRATEGRADEPS